MIQSTLSIFGDVVKKRNRMNVGRYMLREYRMFIKVQPFNCSAAAWIIIVNQFTVRNMEIFKY